MAELNSNGNSTTTKKVRAKKIAPKVDLTAMVDLAFLLITFFMLTTSLNKSNTLDVAVPDKSNNTELDMDERRVINLIVNESNYTLVQGDISKPIKVITDLHVDKKELRDQLSSTQKDIMKITKGKDAIVLIKPSNQSNALGIISSFDEIKKSGIKHYMLSKLSEEESIKNYISISNKI